MSSTQRYDIKDAARYLGVAPSTLRYWEDEGLVRSERNPANDYRQYSLHSLIDASEIAFYRQLGVPVKELKHYHSLTVEGLDQALGHTEHRIEERMAELAAAQRRLASQRDLNACVERLQGEDMNPERPALEQLAAIDYSNPTHWLLLVDDPWRYGLFIEASNPDDAKEGIIEPAAGDDAQAKNDRSPSSELLWSVHQLNESAVCLECLLRVDPYDNESNARALFEKAVQRATEPEAIVATYLVTAVDHPNGRRWDYYRAWVVGNSGECNPTRASSNPRSE